jgi:hypothetical protein
MALTGLVAANNLGDVVDIEKTWDNIGNNISATVFVPSPTLDLNFASNKSLVDNVSGQNLVTFSRASTGTFVGSNGLIQAAASGVPRFDYDPATGESLGLLIEDARTNLMTWSEQISNAAWEKSGDVTVIANDGISPDGNTTANKIIIQSGGTTGRVLRRGLGTNGNCSLYVKAAGFDYLGGEANTAPNNGFPNFCVNLITGQCSSNDGAFVVSAQNVGNGWWRVVLTANFGSNALFLAPRHNFSNGVNGVVGADGVKGIYIWGVQLEAGPFPTSYIPTTSSAVTRAADSASISGSNFSSWFNQTEGTTFCSFKAAGSTSGFYENVFSYATGITSGQQALYRNASNNIGYGALGVGVPIVTLSSWSGINYKAVGAYKANSNIGLGINGILSVSSSSTTPATSNRLGIGEGYNQININKYNGTIARLAYYPVRLSNITLQTLTTLGPVSSFPYSFSIKGRDILALKEVNKTSTKDFIFTKGLLSRAQPRLTTASQYTSSGVALRDAAMPKFAPVTRGNYFFSSGLTLSGATVQINGTNALSIATSPFSSSTATVPLLFAGLRPQTNWRISEAMASGVVASPESAIPIATGDFLLFMKAGQS